MRPMMQADEIIPTQRSDHAYAHRFLADAEVQEPRRLAG